MVGVTVSKGYGAAEEMLKRWTRKARGNPIAEWQVKGAAGYLQAMKDADADRVAMLEEPTPLSLTDEAAKEMSRKLHRASAAATEAHVRFWRHFFDTVAPLLSYDQEEVEAFRTKLLRDNPELAEELEG